LLLIAAITLTPNRFPVLGTTGGRPAGVQPLPTLGSQRSPVWSNHNPEPVVTNAQTPANPAVAGTRYDADHQLFASEPFGRRGRGERINVGAAFVLLLIVVAFVEPTGARLMDAAGHPAGRGVEHQAASLGDRDVHPELQPELAQ
jgi:hypothetical protein